MQGPLIPRKALLTALSLSISCGETQPQQGETLSPYIKEGTSAQDYPSACLIDIFDAKDRVVALCSGALIAPSLVLTAGHCTSGFPKFQVICPYLHQSSYGTGITHPNYRVGAGGSIAADSDDIGVIRLEQRIVMTQYPVVRATRLPDNTLVINIGRVLDGTPSRKELYKSSPVRVKDGKTINFPHDYVTVDKIQPGDSGGPTFLQGAAVPEIVAVNSGTGDGFAILGRTDVVYSWIRGQVVDAGGGALPPGYLPLTPRGPAIEKLP